MKKKKIGDHNDSIWEKDSIKIFEDCLLKNSKVFHVNRTPQQLRKRLVYLTTLDSLKTKEEPKYFFLFFFSTFTQKQFYSSFFFHFFFSQNSFR